MKKYLLVLMALSLFLASCTTVQITNFEECVAAGNDVMEIYPRQCNANGETFVEDVVVDLDDVNKGGPGTPDGGGEVTGPEEGTETTPAEEEVMPETISEAELSMHDMATDCWVAFEDEVYDITDYLPHHEEGADKIIPYCGTSTEFEDAFIGEHEQEQVSKLVKEGLYQGELN